MQVISGALVKLSPVMSPVEQLFSKKINGHRERTASCTLDSVPLWVCLKSEYLKH